MWTQGSRRSALALVALVVAMLAAVGCGSGGSDSDTATSAAGGGDAGLAQVRQTIDAAAAIPRFTPPGPAFDATRLAGKTILNVQENCTNEFINLTESAMAEAAAAVRVKWINYCTQGQPSQWVQGVNQGISQQVDLINLNGGADPRSLQPQLAAAQRAGIKTVSTHLFPVGSDRVPPHLDAVTAVDFAKAARLMADWTLLETDGEPNVLVVMAKEVLPHPVMAEAVQDEIAQHCADCNVKLLNVPAASWATKMQGSVQSALLQDPGINYIIALVDPAVQFITPAITAGGRTGRVKIATYAGTPFALKAIQTGDVVAMDVGESLDWDGWASMDQMLRVLAGEQPLADPKLALRAFHKGNIDEAGTPPEASTGYGDAYRDGYLELWGIGQR